MAWDGPKWGQEDCFPTNPDLVDIWGDTDLDVDNFVFVEYLWIPIFQIFRFLDFQKSGKPYASSTVRCTRTQAQNPFLPLSSCVLMFLNDFSSFPPTCADAPLAHLVFLVLDCGAATLFDQALGETS